MLNSNLCPCDELYAKVSDTGRNLKTWAPCLYITSVLCCESREQFIDPGFLFLYVSLYKKSIKFKD